MYNINISLNLKTMINLRFLKPKEKQKLNLIYNNIKSYNILSVL